MTSIQHHHLTADGVALHYVTAGSGPPLVLIHGFPQTWAQWQRIIARLADRFTIIAPDLRGIGAAPGPASGYDKHSLAGDIRAIVRQVCDDKQALVVGHDMGSFVAYAYALRYRDHVKGLMLVDAPPPGTTLFDGGKSRAWHIGFHCAGNIAEILVAGRERAYIAHFVTTRIHETAAISEADLDTYAAAYSAPGAMRSAFEMYRALDRDSEFNRAALKAGGKLAMPVVFVGASYRMTAEPLVAMGAEIAENMKVVLVDRSGHWISEEQPDILAKEISDLANACQ